MENIVLKNRNKNSNYYKSYMNYCDDKEYNLLKQLENCEKFDVFNQAASEAIVYYFFRHKGNDVEVSHDVRLNLLSSKDVDVVASKIPSFFDIRVEVKAPEIALETGRPRVQIAYRGGNNPQSKKLMDNACASFQAQSRLNGGDVQIEKLDDLKIKTYLTNANAKFGAPSDSYQINILFVSCNTHKMCDFFDIIQMEKQAFFQKIPIFASMIFLILII